VEIALVVAVLIVTLVIYLFLLDWRATLIPTISMPIALIGTHRGDLHRRLLDQHPDAARHRAGHRTRRGRRHRGAGEHRAPPCRRPEAAGGRRPRHAQVFFAVIATTATLAAVFVPLSFLPGQMGAGCSANSASCSPLRLLCHSWR
jgi:HAE1 family hydrophobic/amphiphilic exporter-1